MNPCGFFKLCLNRLRQKETSAEAIFNESSLKTVLEAAPEMKKYAESLSKKAAELQQNEKHLTTNKALEIPQQFKGFKDTLGDVSNLLGGSCGCYQNSKEAEELLCSEVPGAQPFEGFVVNRGALEESPAAKKSQTVKERLLFSDDETELVSSPAN